MHGRSPRALAFAQQAHKFTFYVLPIVLNPHLSSFSFRAFDMKKRTGSRPAQLLLLGTCLLLLGIVARTTGVRLVYSKSHYLQGADDIWKQQNNHNGLKELTRGRLNTVECLLSSGFDWQPMNGSSGWHLMSTVEAHPYPSGMQARCDMVIGSRFTKFQPSLHRRAWIRSWSPRTVFVRNDLMQSFVKTVLPCLSEPFVLLSGDSDLTLPRQIDLRFPKVLDPSLWHQLLEDDRVIHMFVENLDSAVHPKLSGLPLGVSAYNYPNRQADYLLSYVQSRPAVIPLTDRPLRAMHVARLRDGRGQWADRQHVQDLCVRNWSNMCNSPSGLNTTGLWQAMQAVPFVLCAHGGGLDPSPKAWEALLLGSIPIIQHFPGDDAYNYLPVVFVDSWHEGSLSQNALERWRRLLQPWFVDPIKRTEVLHRLSLEFWWQKVTAALEGRLIQFQTDHPYIALEWRPSPSEQGPQTITPPTK